MRDYYDITFADGQTARLRYDDYHSETRPAAGDSNTLVLRFGDIETDKDGEPGTPTVTINGAVSDIALNAVSLPDTKGITSGADSYSYRITDRLYLTRSGLVVTVMQQKQAGGGRSTVFASKYDGSVYTSTKIIARNLDAANATSRPSITIRKGELIWRELRTDVIATDRNGNYWYKGSTDSAWQLASKNITKNPGHVSVDIRRDGYGTVSYGGKEYLRIAYEDEKDESGKLTGRKVLYYYLPVGNGSIRAGADGTVSVIKGDPYTQRLLYDTKGTEFLVHNILAADNVEIWMTGPKDSLIDGDPQNQDDVDIKAGDMVSIYSESSGSIGSSEANRIEVEAVRQEMFDLGGERVIRTDAYIYQPEGDLRLEGHITVDGAEWNVATHDGRVVFSTTEELTYNLTVLGGGKAIISTNILRDGTDNSAARSSGDIRIHEVYAYGRSDSCESQVNLFADGNTEIDTLTLGNAAATAGGLLNAEIGGSLTVNGVAKLVNGSEANINAVGGALFSDILTVQGNSDFNLTSTNGGMTVEKATVMEKNVTVINPSDLHSGAAVQIADSDIDESFRHPDSTDGQEITVVGLGLYVLARNGSVRFITLAAEDDDVNTLDFTAENSNVDIDARDHVTLLEARFSDADLNVKSSGVVATRGRSRMLMSRGGEGPESLVSIANWVVADHSNVNVTALGDINVLYNLNAVDEAERIAERELTIIGASHVNLTSTEGGVYILRDYDPADSASTIAYEGDYVGANIYTPDVLITGIETAERTRDDAFGERSSLSAAGAKTVKVANILSDFADVSLRSTQESLLFDIIRGEETNTRLAAEQHIDALHPELSPVISYHDRLYDGDASPIDTPNNASLTLYAGLDIGREEHHLYVDVPEELTVRIEKVRNLYLTALKADETGVPERLTWDNRTLSYSEADGKMIVDETAFRIGYSEEYGMIIAGEAENSDGEETYTIIVPEFQEENLPDWLMERSESIYGLGEVHPWTYLIDVNVDLETYILEPYEEMTDSQIEAAVSKEFGAELLKAAKKAVKDEECETILEILVQAALTPSGTLDEDEEDSEKLVEIYDETSELIFRRLFEDGLVNSYTDETNTKTAVDRKTQILRIIGRDWDYATKFAGEIRDTVNGFSDSTVVETESLDTWLLARSRAVYGDDEAVAWTNLVPATAAELEEYLLASYEGMSEKEIETAVTEAYGKEILTLAKQAVKNGESESVQRFIATAALTPTGRMADEQKKADYDTVSEAVFRRLYAEGMVTAYTDENGKRELSQKEQITALASRDAAYAAANAQQLLTASAVDDSSYQDAAAHSRVSNYLTAANRRLDEAEQSIRDNSAERMSLQDAIRALNEQEIAQTVEKERLAALEDELAALKQALPGLTDPDEIAANRAEQTQLETRIRSQKAKVETERAAETRAKALDELNAQLAAANTELRTARMESVAAEVRLDELNEAIIRNETFLADYSREGSVRAETGDWTAKADTAAWQSDAEAAIAGAEQALAAGEIERAHELVNEALTALESARSYSQVSLENAIALTQPLATLADAVAESDIALRAAAAYETAYDDYSTVYKTLVETARAEDDIREEEKVLRSAKYETEEDKEAALADWELRLERAQTETAAGNTVRTEDKPTGSLYLHPAEDASLAERLADTVLTSELPTVFAGRSGSLPESEEGEELASVFAIRKDTLRYFDESQATSLSATAENGSIYLTERTGSVGAGEIRAAQDVVLTAVNGAESKVASEDDRSTVAVGGVMTVHTNGDVSLISEGDLTLKLDTITNHVDITTDADKGPGDITVISDKTKELTGTALSNGSVTLENGGDIGTEAQSFVIDSVIDAGTVTLRGDDVYVDAQHGITVNEIQAEGDLELTVGGDLADAGNTGLGDTIDRVTEAQEALTEAQRAMTDETWSRVEAEELKKLADEAVTQAAADKAEAEQALTEAEQALNDAEQALNDALAALDPNDEESAQALAEAIEAVEEAEAVKTEAEAALAEAAEAVEEAQRALDEAETAAAVKKAEKALEKAQEALADAQESYDEADAALDEAQQRQQDAEEALQKADAEVALVEQMQERLEKAKADGTPEAEAKADEALAAAKQVVMAQVALDEAVAADKAAQTALTAAQSAEAEAETEAQLAADALHEALESLSAAQTQADEAEEALEAAQNGSAAERRAAEKALQEAQEALADAQQSYDEAERQDSEAQTALAEAQNARREAEENKQAAEQRIVETETALDEAQALYEAAADAAEKQLEKEAAEQTLGEAEAEQAEVARLIGELSTAQQTLEQAEQQQRSDYSEYLRSNTGLDTAQRGRSDTRERGAALDRQNNTVSERTADVSEIEQKLIAITGTADPTAAAAAAQQKVDDADAAAGTARADSAASDAALDRAKTENGSIRNDPTGTSMLRADDAKSGDAAIRVGGNAEIGAAGSIGGQNGQELTLNVDGTAAVAAGGDVRLQSGEDMKLNSLTGGNISVTTYGNILGVGKDPTVTGSSTALNAISTRGDSSAVGKADGSPLTVDTQQLALRGDAVGVSTTGSVTLGDVVAQTATLNVNGGVTREPGTEIDTNDLTIRAKGDIGAAGDPMVIHTDTHTASGSNVYIHNLSENLTANEIIGRTVEIETEGAIGTGTGGLITAHELSIVAGYEIGSEAEPLRVLVDGTLYLHSRWGEVFFRNLYRVEGGWITLYDPITGINVTAKFAEDARLEVLNTAHYAQLRYPALRETPGCGCEALHAYSEHCEAAMEPVILSTLLDNSDSKANSLLWSLIRDGRALYDFVMGVFSEGDIVCWSEMYVEIPLSGLDSAYDGSLEGETLYVLLGVDDNLVCVPAAVTDGSLRFMLRNLGMDDADCGYTQFVIVDAAVFESILEAAAE